MQMADQELITALRRMAPETGSLICQGCGYERNCPLHGCTVLRAAADRLTELSAPPPNPPLTLEELREMDGEPVYFDCGPGHGEWAIVLIRPEAESEVFLRLKNGALLSAKTVYARIVFRHRGNIYRRKPEEGMPWQQ